MDLGQSVQYMQHARYTEGGWKVEGLIHMGAEEIR